MITIYLDHNVIDGFDKGEVDLDPLLSIKECLPVMSLPSVDEIFRGGDEARSLRNIESLKRLGIRYIWSGPDKHHMTICDLDYEAMRGKWVEMQSEIGPLNNAHFQFINALFCGREPGAMRSMDEALTAQIKWIKSNYEKHPNVQNQMAQILESEEEYKKLCGQLLFLRELLPFTAKEINNIPARSVFWVCVQRLKDASDENLQVIGNHICEAVQSAETITEQFDTVFLWLNFFGYHPDDLTQIARVRANFSDGMHAAYSINCNGMLTVDKRFAKRAAAAIGALELRTKVGTSAQELLQSIMETDKIRIAE